MQRSAVQPYSELSEDSLPYILVYARSTFRFFRAVVSSLNYRISRRTDATLNFSCFAEIGDSIDLIQLINI